MADSKTIFKLYTIFQNDREEAYLSSMHEQGWKCRSIHLGMFYHFEKTEAKKAVYRIDYNKEGLKHKGEYIRMFADCGWKYVGDSMGFSYFVKEGDIDPEDEQIFCDDESRFDKMKRIFIGKIIPLIVYFLAFLLPMTLRYYQRFPYFPVLSVIMLVLMYVYLALFGITAWNFYRYEKKLRYDQRGINMKYAGIAALVAVLAIGAATVFYMSTRSVYEISDTESGFVLEAEQLNRTVTREYDLHAGERVDVDLQSIEGSVHMSFGIEGKDPQFFADFNGSDTFWLETMEDGHYVFEISGRNSECNVNVNIV